MPSGVGNKYHLALSQVDTSSVVGAPVGYMLRPNGYTKSDSETFAPRFGTGAEGLNNLDLWKTYQHTDLSGGALQQRYLDPTKLAVSRNSVYNATDKLLYPTAVPTLDSYPTGGSISAAKGYVYYQNEMWRISNKVGFGAVAKWTGSAWVHQKSDFATNVSSIAILYDKIWVATTGGLFWAWNGTTWVSQAGFGVTTLCRFGSNKMYCSGAPGTKDEGRLFSHNGDTTTPITAIVGDVGDINKKINTMVEFNHRLYIGKSDGLFAFDGVQVSTILDYSHDIDNSHFSYMEVFSGALYFVLRNTLYRYTGASVEKLKTFDNYGDIRSMDAAYGRLWFSIRVPDLTKSSAVNYTYDWYYFDGVGFFHYFTSPMSVLYSATAQNLPIQCFYDPTRGAMVFCHAGDPGAGGQPENLYYISMLNEFYTGTRNDLTVETSEFDAGFPYIDKYCDSATISYEGAYSGDTLTVYFRIHDGTSWGAWSSTIGGTFKRIQMRVVLHRQTASSTAALSSFSFRFILSPDLKRKWALTVICLGTSDSPHVLADGSQETNTPKQLREQIYQCRMNDVPSFMEDVDTCLLASTLALATGAGGTITVGSTAGFPPSGYVKIEDELILYSAKTATTFTISLRGRWGTAAAQHLSGVIVGTAYRVVINKIANERIVAPNISSEGVMDVNGNESELSLIVQEA